MAEVEISSDLSMQTVETTDHPTLGNKENDSGVRDLDCKTETDSSSCDSDEKSTTSTVASSRKKGSTGDEEDDKGINLTTEFSSTEEPKTIEISSQATTLPPEPGTSTSDSRRGSSVSRRARRSGGGRNSRGGSRRGGKGNRIPDNYWNTFSAQIPSAFHTPITPIFSSLQGEFDNLKAGSLPETLRRGNDDIPAAPGFLSRDLMIQLMKNINSGFFYISQSFELLKQSQLELYHAKHTLERVYKSQHGDFTEGFYEDFGSAHQSVDKTEENEDDLSDNRSQMSTDEIVEKTSERFQVSLNPFQFIEQSDESVSTCVSEFISGRAGRGRGGRPVGMKQQRRKRQQNEYFSVYNPELARKSAKDLIEHLSADIPVGLMDEGDVKKYQPIVRVIDLQPTLQSLGEIKPNIYSAARIDASMKRQETRRVDKMKKGKSKSKKNVSEDVKEDEAPAPMEVQVEEPEEDTASKKVSKNTISSANEENGVHSRKDPVTVPEHDSTSESNRPSKDPKTENLPEENGVHNCKDPVTVATHDNSSESNRPPKASRNQTLPLWRTYRVEPEVLERVKRRVYALIDQSAKEALQSSAASSDGSSASDASRKESSPITDEDKDTSHENSTVSGLSKPKPEMITKVSKAALLVASAIENDDSSTKSAFSTPPNEVMLDLTPEKDNCACVAKDDKKRVKAKSDILTDSEDEPKQRVKINKGKEKRKLLSKKTSSMDTEIVAPQDEPDRFKLKNGASSSSDTSFEDDSTEDLFIPIPKRRPTKKRQKRDK